MHLVQDQEPEYIQLTSETAGKALGFCMGAAIVFFMVGVISGSVITRPIPINIDNLISDRDVYKTLWHDQREELKTCNALLAD